MSVEYCVLGVGYYRTGDGDESAERTEQRGRLFRRDPSILNTQYSTPHGDSRSTTHPVSSGRYRSRSWRRLSLPCQNSSSSGSTRNPPQCGGSGGSSPNFFPASTTF